MSPMTLDDAFRRINGTLRIGADAMRGYARVALVTDGIRNRNISRAQTRSRSNQSKMVKHGRQHR